MAIVAVCAGAAAIIGAALPINVALPAFWFFTVIGAGSAIIDVRCRRLPHLLTGALLACSVVCFAIATTSGGNADAIIRAAVAGLVTTTVLFVIALALPGQLGLGDVAFTGVMAFNLGWLSWQAVLYGIVGGWLAQGLVIVAARVSRYQYRVNPMGPALMCGWLFAVLCAT